MMQNIYKMYKIEEKCHANATTYALGRRNNGQKPVHVEREGCTQVGHEEMKYPMNDWSVISIRKGLFYEVNAAYIYSLPYGYAHTIGEAPSTTNSDGNGTLTFSNLTVEYCLYRAATRKHHDGLAWATDLESASWLCDEEHDPKYIFATW
jgi:hypothetical protein